MGGDKSLSGSGILIGSTSLVTTIVIGDIFSSILTRDCAWRAFEALALKRSMKAWMCFRCASCYLAIFWSSIRRSARSRSKSV